MEQKVTEKVEILFSKFFCKVEKIQEDSLDWIPLPSPNENSNFWRESLLEVIRQNIAGGCEQTFETKNFVDNAQQCFAFRPQANFPTNNLNFH